MTCSKLLNKHLQNLLIVIMVMTISSVLLIARLPNLPTQVKELSESNEKVFFITGNFIVSYATTVMNTNLHGFCSCPKTKYSGTKAQFLEVWPLDHPQQNHQGDIARIQILRPYPRSHDIVSLKVESQKLYFKKFTPIILVFTEVLRITKGKTEVETILRCSGLYNQVVTTSRICILIYPIGF